MITTGYQSAGRWLSWASGLGTEITSYNNVTWGENAWRLPATIDGVFNQQNPPKDGNEAGGYNVTYSELWHLFYAALGNVGYYDIDGVSTGQVAPQNYGPFDNLGNKSYWYSTLYTAADPGFHSAMYPADPRTITAWLFSMWGGVESIGRFFELNPNGYYYNDSNSGHDVHGIALRNATVTSTEPVPEPATMILFGTGLAGLAAARRRKKAS